MIVVMKTGATEEQVAGVRKAIKELGFKDHPILGEERSVVAVLGHVYPELVDELGDHNRGQYSRGSPRGHAGAPLRNGGGQRYRR